MIPELIHNKVSLFISFSWHGCIFRKQFDYQGNVSIVVRSNFCVPNLSIREAFKASVHIVLRRTTLRNRAQTNVSKLVSTHRLFKRFCFEQWSNLFRHHLSSVHKIQLSTRWEIQVSSWCIKFLQAARYMQISRLAADKKYWKMILRIRI